ncbi:MULTISPECIES: caspase family protein [Paenibacillus]|uniref:Peptidase C14 caspase domain-containing protein n=1 Tax=Paenibacillus odorifer TaxID=189426 RepID=A0ABX3HIM4_9BACL|nr:caspase family protein [Paenibacillus odorifer]OMD18632.1 hypothetical protein BJP48_12780 [Paenibacillus odorifer]OMD50455.1 hypothetical protein BSK51_15885 [Paenibacillus odorifer]
MDYSISIGIESYSRLNKTLYADNDAKEFDRIMVEIFNIEKHILLLNNDASFINIRSEFNSIAKHLTKEDRLFFFFAGHGKNVYGTPYLSAWDSDDIVTETWHSLTELMGVINEGECNKAIFFIDACESTINYGLRNNTAETALQPMNIDLDNLEYTYVFSSASHKETANVNDESMHGIWSTYLFESLLGKTEEALDNSKLTNNSLQNYLNRKVSDYCKKNSLHYTQKSHGWGKFEREFLIIDFSDNTFYKEVPIEKIYFGNVDAIGEIKNNDIKFEHNFYNLNRISNAVLEDGSIQLVLGKKGTGKTFVGKYIEETNKDKVCFINFERFNYNNFNALKNVKSNGYERFEVAWEWVLLSYVVELLSKKLGGDFKELYDELFVGRMTLNKVLDRKLKKGIPLNNKFSSMLRKQHDIFKIDEIVSLYKLLLENCENNDSIFLILDGLDEKINEFDYYQDVMNSLLMTVKHLNNELFEMDLNLKIVIFLRHDVYEMITGANLGKLQFGGTAELDWINFSIDKINYPLRDFMEVRINTSVVFQQGKAIENPLRNLLPEKMNLGKPTEANTWDWILDFTTYKPRDLIAFFNSCVKLCNNGETKLTEQILWDATKQYSNYLKEEFEDELFGFLTDKQKNEIFELVLPKMRKNWISYETLKGYINQGDNCRNMDNNELIGRLYRIGMLGAKIEEKEQWSYRGKRAILNESELVNSKFKVHLGLWKYFMFW